MQEIKNGIDRTHLYLIQVDSQHGAVDVRIALGMQIIFSRV